MEALDLIDFLDFLVLKLCVCVYIFCDYTTLMFIMKERSPHGFTNKNIISLRFCPKQRIKCKECMLFGNDAIKRHWRNVLQHFCQRPIKRNVKAQSVQTDCFNPVLPGNRHIKFSKLFCSILVHEML